MDYQLVSPERFTEEQSEFVAQFRQSVTQISGQTDMIVGAKDANSRHLASSDAYARIVALKRGDDVVDRLDKEMPCEGTAQFADCYVQEDLALMQTCDPTRKVSILNVHEYGDGCSPSTCSSTRRRAPSWAPSITRMKSRSPTSST